MKTSPLLLALGLALSPSVYAQAKASVVAVESVEDFMKWLGTPVDPVRATATAKYAGRVTQLEAGKKVALPILVTGLPFPGAPEMRIVADLEVVRDDGKLLAKWPQCCKATVASDAKSIAVLLGSTVILEPEAGRPKGSYTVRVSVSTGTNTLTATEVLPFKDGEMPGAATEAPRLRMNVPASESGEARGGPGDKRDCLSLPTQSEIIRCSEKK